MARTLLGERRREAASPGRKHHLYLSHEQREELKQIVIHDTPARGRRARALLFLDEGLHGPGLKECDVAERVGFSSNAVGSLLVRANEMGPKRAAVGRNSEHLIGTKRPGVGGGSHGKGGGPGSGPRPKLTPEEEKEYAELFATGKYTKSELARRADVHESTMGRVLKRQQKGNGQGRT